MKGLVWFRSDLRAADNSALAAACARGGEVAGLFVISPDEWAGHDVAPARVELMLRTLRELSETLTGLNIPLLVRTAKRAGDVPQVVADVLKEIKATNLDFNREYEINEARRDQRTIELCGPMGVEAVAHHDQTALTPSTPRTGEGRAFSVFTPYRKAWLRTFAETPRLPIRKPKPAKPSTLRAEAIPDRVAGFESAIPVDLWPGGESEAVRRLKTFAKSRIEHYKSRRDLPAEDATSTLSPYLAVGAISPRQCVAAACEAGGLDPAELSPETFDKLPPGPQCWISEVIWREFYVHILANFPRVCMNRAFQPLTDKIRWSENTEHFEAWKAGRTGIPIVDAGMRQLAATGWMHNRVRMITAMFLSKNLFLNWRWGERHFMRSLVDGFFASNNGGWQWSASTGTDAAPYFRIFNPISQSRTNDPEGRYIRRWVPELAKLDADAIHNPHDPKEGLPPLAAAKLDYPKPIVDLGETRNRAIEAFKQLRAD